MEFHNGNFVINKSRREFSAMAIDQAHEHKNAVTKDDRGGIGLTEDPSALRRWMVPRPVVSRLQAGYEVMPGEKDASYSNRHHEQTLSDQRSFFEKVKSLSTVIQQMGNPFQEESADLMVLDTTNIADPTLEAKLSSYHLRKDSFFKQEQTGGMSKEKVLKDDCQLFSRLFIPCQNRQCNLQAFFKHENLLQPASLSDSGKLHMCQKSQLVEILEAQVNVSVKVPNGDTVIIGGSPLINAYLQRHLMTMLEKTSSQRWNPMELGTGSSGNADCIWPRSPYAIVCVVSAIGLEKARGIPYFHAFSGCDVVSAFSAKAKKFAWQTWNVFDDINGIFDNPSQHSTLIRDLDMQRLERFAVLMYDRSTAATGVDGAGLDLFAHKQIGRTTQLHQEMQSSENIQSVQHTRLGSSGARLPNPDMSSPFEWGWTQKGEAL